MSTALYVIGAIQFLGAAVFAYFGLDAMSGPTSFEGIEFGGALAGLSLGYFAGAFGSIAGGVTSWALAKVLETVLALHVGRRPDRLGALAFDE